MKNRLLIPSAITASLLVLAASVYTLTSSPQINSADDLSQIDIPVLPMVLVTASAEILPPVLLPTIQVMARTTDVAFGTNDSPTTGEPLVSHAAMGMPYYSFGKVAMHVSKE